MSRAKGLTGIDYQLEPPGCDAAVPWRNDQQATSHRQRLETIHPGGRPSGIRDGLTQRRPAIDREHTRRRDRTPNRREPGAAEPLEKRAEFQRRVTMRATMVPTDRASERSLRDQHRGRVVDHRGRRLENDLHVFARGKLGDLVGVTGHRPSAIKHKGRRGA